MAAKPKNVKYRWRTIKAFPAGGAAAGGGIGVVAAAVSTLIPVPGVAALVGLILLGVGLLLPKKHQGVKAALISGGIPMVAVDTARGFAWARAKWFPPNRQLPAPADEGGSDWEAPRGDRWSQEDSGTVWN